MNDTREVWANTSWYMLEDAANVRTPALAIYPEAVRSNIAATLRLMEGDPSRWRPHLKTLKSVFTIRMLVEAGVMQAKCATTRELEAACDAGMQDVLVAYPLARPSIQRVASIAKRYPGVRISGLVESVAGLDGWRGLSQPLFIDIDLGMHRTGISVDDHGAVHAVARAMRQLQIPFAGLHCYDGHSTDPDLTVRTAHAHGAYEKVMALAGFLRKEQVEVMEVITSGSPAFPCALSFMPFRTDAFRHRCSPGTIVLGDLTSLSQLPASYGYRPAALVLSRFVSFPTGSIATLDAGSKAVSVDAGLPHCRILEYPEAIPQRPSEEHLPVDVSALSGDLSRDGVVHLLPRHVCTTVHNFGQCIVLERGKAAQVVPIDARDRDTPIG